MEQNREILLKLSLLDRRLVEIEKSLNIKQKTKHKDYEYYKKLEHLEYRKALEEWFERRTGEKLNLDNPQTFNEKIQWLKLYESTPLKTKLADKYAVREWVQEKIGEKHLIPLLGVWDSFDEINFDTLPEKFVLKCTHGCGMNLIVKDKKTINYEEAKKKFNQWLQINYAFSVGLELHYKNIPPKIIAETYIAELDGEIYDFRVFCFNGEPKTVYVDAGSGTPEHTRNIYDLEWNLQPILVSYPPLKIPLEKPRNFEQMLDMARILSEGITFVRVDFYDMGETIYFGEMTFTPQSGIGNMPKDHCREFGDWIELPKARYSYD